MKQAIAFLLLAAFIVSAGLPTLAQQKTINSPRVQSLPVGGEKAQTLTKSQAPDKKVPGLRPKGTRFQSAEAYSDGKNVWLRWSMEVENDNFGFNVYVIDTGGKRLLNDSIILGGATKIANRPVYGEEYQFLTISKNPSALYVIETTPLSGKKVSTDPLFPTRVSDVTSLSGFSLSSLPRLKTGTGRIETSSPILDGDLQSEVTLNALAPDPGTQKWIAAQPGVKIGVKTEGIYRVTKAQLQAGGFDVNSDPNTWQLYVNGLEQAINVAPNGDYIEFYGKGLDTIENDTQTYFLIAGPAAGKRMAIRQIGPGLGNVLSNSYSQTFVKKERTLYLDDILNGDAENYFGSTISPFSAYTLPQFNLSGIDTAASTFTISVKFQGFSAVPHSVAITLNGHVLTPASGTGLSPYSGEYLLPVAYLNEGANALTMQSTGGNNDISLFDQVDVTYQRTYLATQNRLSFYTQNYKTAQLDGFTSPNARVFDITYDGNPVKWTGISFQSTGTAFGTRVPASRGRVLFAVEDSGILSPTSVTANTPSTLSTANHNANLIIITYKNWAAQAENWANYRRGQGFLVEVVDVADIFDEFNYGVLSADSLKSFLEYAKNNWQTPPQYVLLLGDATFDPRNYDGAGFADYVPAKIVTTLFSETASDDALVDFNNDGVAEIAIGRIPVRSGTAATNALNKVINFEQPAMQTLDRGTLFVTGTDSFFSFRAMSDSLISQLPAGTPSVTVDQVQGGTQQQIVDGINTGKYVVNFVGHGSVGVWQSTGYFSSNNVINCAGQPTCINNPGHESIFVMLTCLNGYFLTTFNNSLAENLLSATNGGAVATWASTGETTPDVQQTMGQRFYLQLGQTNITRMGDLIMDAKAWLKQQDASGTDVLNSWALLGDPMLKVKP
jgi:hypothetical protein